MYAAFARVLAVDDKSNTTELLDGSLENFGLEIKTVREGRAAPEAVIDWHPEAIVLDAGLSGIDCFSLIGSLRRLTEVPILVVSDRSETSDTVKALTRGADDYLIKPFATEELAARIYARLRRPRMEPRAVVAYADLSIDVAYRKAARAGKALELSTREFDLLLTLARNPEKVFTRSHLLDLVWGVDHDVTPSTVETYISYLRAKIDVVGAVPIIQTIRGVGYTMCLGQSSRFAKSAA